MKPLLLYKTNRTTKIIVANKTMAIKGAYCLNNASVDNFCVPHLYFFDSETSDFDTSFTSRKFIEIIRRIWVLKKEKKKKNEK